MPIIPEQGRERPTLDNQGILSLKLTVGLLHMRAVLKREDIWEERPGRGRGNSLSWVSLAEGTWATGEDRSFWGFSWRERAWSVQDEANQRCWGRKPACLQPVSTGPKAPHPTPPPEVKCKATAGGAPGSGRCSVGAASGRNTLQLPRPYPLCLTYSFSSW